MVQQTTAATQSRQTGGATAQCLIAACPNEARFRGLCARCHQNARRAITAGATTEQELLDRQLMLPSVRGKRKNPSPWQCQFDRACQTDSAD